MGAVKELIRAEADGSISFGDYTLSEKTKKSDFSYEGDIYKVKTYKDVTKLEKNELFIFESVPGTAVNNFKMSGDAVEFSVSGNKDTDVSVTLELSPDTEYSVTMADQAVGNMSTKSGGKLSLSLSLSEEPVFVRVVKA